MTVDRLALRNFLMFTGAKKLEDSIYNLENGIPLISPIGYGSFDETFVNGINVFIGANGTGKSTLLKCMYAACEFSNQQISPDKGKRVQDYFSSSKKQIKDINQKSEDNDFGLITVLSGDSFFEFRAWDNALCKSDFEQWQNLNIKSVMIPTAEMLSHSSGLVAMNSKYGIPFDQTQIDILVNAQLWETNELSETSKQLLAVLSTAIDGEVVFEDDTFYVIKNNGLKVEFSLEAEGFRKLGLLWKLIRNGLLDSGSILFWDEPEASINPELIPLIVDVLYMLKNNGVQVFVATHNYSFAKYIDIKNSGNDALFISLKKADNGEIVTARAAKYSSLENNPIEASEEKLYDAIVKKSMEEAHAR